MTDDVIMGGLIDLITVIGGICGMIAFAGLIKYLHFNHPFIYKIVIGVLILLTVLLYLCVIWMYFVLERMEDKEYAKMCVKYQMEKGD